MTKYSNFFMINLLLNIQIISLKLFPCIKLNDGKVVPVTEGYMELSKGGQGAPVAVTDRVRRARICIKYAGETVRQTRDNNLLEKILAKVIDLEGRLKMERAD